MRTAPAYLSEDCERQYSIEGVCVQTETVLRQALTERIKPVVIINKVDRALLELQVQKEDLYQSFSRTIESVNVIISTYNDKALGDVQVYPEQGTIAFGSGLHGWAFSLSQFAKRYAKKFGVDREKMMARLWGDNYFNPKTKKWTNKGVDADGKPLERCFNVRWPCFASLASQCSRCADVRPRPHLQDLRGDDEQQEGDRLPHVGCARLSPFPVGLGDARPEKLEVSLKQEEKDLEGKALLKVIMRNFLPAGSCFLVDCVERV